MNKDGKLAGVDLLGAIFFIALGIVVLYLSSQMKVFRNSLIISPGLFPMILGGVFILCGGVLLVMAILRGGVADCARILAPGHLAAIAKSPTFIRGACVFLFILLYVALFGNPYLAKLNFPLEIGSRMVLVNVGFILLTFSYLFVTFLYLKAMKWSAAFAVSLIAAVVIFFSFNQGFGIPIP